MYVDDMLADLPPHAGVIVDFMLAAHAEMGAIGHVFGPKKFVCFLQAPAGTPAETALARATELMAALRGEMDKRGANVLGELSVVVTSTRALGMRVTHTRNFKDAVHQGINMASRWVRTQALAGFCPPRLCTKATARWLEQPALPHLTATYALKGPPTGGWEGQMVELERQMAAVVLGCGQLAPVVGGGRAAGAARSRVLAATVPTAVARRDAGIRPGGIAAMRAMGRYFGRVWARPHAYPAGVVDAVMRGLALAAADLQGALANRSPPAVWLQAIGEVKGSPWARPRGGWQMRAVLDRFATAPADDVQAYWRTLEAHTRAATAAAWAGTEGETEDNFVTRAATALGGGPPPQPHWALCLDGSVRAAAEEGADRDAPRRALLAMRTGQTAALHHAVLRQYRGGGACGMCGVPEGGDVPHLLFACPALAAPRSEMAQRVETVIGAEGVAALAAAPADARAAVLLGGDMRRVSSMPGMPVGAARTLRRLLGTGRSVRAARHARHRDIVDATARFGAHASDAAAADGEDWEVDGAAL